MRVVLAGPPNAGKSSLFNALVGREAAITSAIPGTTRDIVEAPVAIAGTPFLLIDTAGLRTSEDEVEAIGVERAQSTVAAADLVLWLGRREKAPERSLVVRSKSDIEPADPAADFAVSARTGAGIDLLTRDLVKRAQDLLPREGEVAVNVRHRARLAECVAALDEAAAGHDPLIVAEALRSARLALDRITGRAGIEDMLDALFGRFCIGK